MMGLARSAEMYYSILNFFLLPVAACMWAIWILLNYKLSRNNWLFIDLVNESKLQIAT